MKFSTDIFSFSWNNITVPLYSNKFDMKFDMKFSAENV